MTVLANCWGQLVNGPGRLNFLPWPWEFYYFIISNSYVTFKELVVVGWWKRYHKMWCEWQVWPVHSLTITIGAPTGPYDLMIILVLEEDTLNCDWEIITENTAREYKRRNEISLGQLQLSFRDRLNWAQHIEQKLWSDSGSESGSASSA